MSEISKQDSGNNYYYPHDNSLVDETSLSELDEFAEKIAVASQANPELWITIQQKYRIDWIYHSNAIEGSTLTRGETHYLLTEGTTADGKPYRDHRDAINHDDAVGLLHQHVKDNSALSEGMMKEFNALLLRGVKFTNAEDQFGKVFRKPATPGKYKTFNNHVLKPDGEIHHYVEPLHVASQMEELVNWVNGGAKLLHPLIVAAIAHYHFVRIHPFDDGNGRGARILMNFILISSDFPPAVVKNEKRSNYIDALNEATKGDYRGFVRFILLTIDETLRGIYSDIVT